MIKKTNETRDVLLVGDKDPYSKWEGYAEEFIRRGWRVTIVFYYRNPLETGESRISDSLRAIVLGPDTSPRHDPVPDLVEFVEVTAGHGSLPKFLFNEVFLYDRTYEEVVAEANAMWPRLTHLFASTRFDLVVQNQGAGPLRRLVFALAKQRGIPVLYFDVAWFGDRMFISDNEMNRVTEYRPIPVKEFPSTELDEIRSFRDDRLNKREIYQYLFPEKSTSGIAARLRMTTSKALKKNLWRSLEYRARRFRKKIRSLTTDVLFERFNSTRVPDTPFFFFPLHYPKDSQVALRAQEHLRQETLIEFVHWNMPDGVCLLVKPHPQAKGDYDRSALSLIRRLKNVALIRSRYSTHEILDSPYCLGTIVLNSSVGFESLLHGRPVVAVGDFYGINYPGFVFRPTLNELSQTIRSVLDAEIDDAHVLGALASIRRATYPGTIYSPKIEYTRVVESLLEKVRRIESGDTA